MQFNRGPGARTPGAGLARVLRSEIEGGLARSASSGARRSSRRILAALLPALLVIAAFTSNASAALSGVGVTDPATGFPSSYSDSNGVVLQPCLDGLPNCLTAAADLTPPGGEGFYFAADATVGPMNVANHLEAAYAAAGTGQEVTFMRTQVDAAKGGLTPNGKYTITDPYGVLNCVADGTGVIKANGCRTETTPVPLDFKAALSGRIGPFLTWDTFGSTGTGAPPAGYIGDNVTPHKVIGSPTGFNKVRVEGPGFTGTCTNADGTTVSNCQETDLFVVQGKVAPGASAVVTPSGPVNFGNVGPGTYTKTLTYTNTGTLPMTVDSVALGGANAADFSVANGCALTAAFPGLAPGGKCTIDISFTPRANVASSATLTLNDSWTDPATSTPGTNSRVINLSGSSKPVMSVAPATLDTATGLAFGSQFVNSTSAEHVFSVQNDGPVPATITTRQLGGLNAAHFTLAGTTNTCDTPVLPGDGCEIGVKFAPTTTGNKTASLTLTDSGGTKLSTAVSLTGTGLAAPTVNPPTLTPASGTYSSAQSVTMSAATGTTIRYTTGTAAAPPADPTATTGTLYSAPVSVSSSQVIKARAFDANGVASAVAQNTYTINIPPSAPTVTPATGTYTTAQSVTMSAAAGTTIRYTIGVGTTPPADPTAASTAYTGPISVSTSQVIKAVAFDGNGVPSSVVQRSYTIAPAGPTVTPATGTYTTAQSVSMSAAAGTTIRYTTGTAAAPPADPTATTGTLYSAPVSVSSSQVIKARAFDANNVASAVVQRTYTINLPGPAAPTVTPATGTYTTAQSVSMSAAAGTTIRYTTGTAAAPPADPTATTGTLYSAPVSVSSSQVIKARAFDANGASAVVQRDYTISAPNAAPTVTARTPAVNATGASTTGNITATFSEAVNGVSATTFTLKNAATGAAVAATSVAYNATTRVATFDPSVTLAADTKYTATLTSGITDQGTPAAALATTSWTFTTGPVPTVSTRTPAANAFSVPVANNITATFSEPVTGLPTTAGTSALFTLKNAAGTAIAATVVYNATTRVATLDPTANLAADTKYTATLTGGASGIKDAGGNPLATTTWTFTTGPAPTVSARTPASGATGVSRTANITATFSEAVQGLPGTTAATSTLFTLKATATGTAVSGVVNRNGTTNQYILNPGVTLNPNTQYTVTLTGGTSGIRDSAGNPLAATSWSFTTGP
jgi:Bacterial Ig-like domain/Chitobiase/beta-hexosaminidase C-terminal domain